MQSPPFPRYLVPPRSKYSPQHHILKHAQLPSLSQCQRPGFTPILAYKNLHSCTEFRRRGSGVDQFIITGGKGAVGR